MYRVGIGYDIHRLENGLPLIIGGVTLPYARGLEGHSDADVLVHAIMDAMLGAASLPDIGVLFSDSDEKYRGIDSLILLREVKEKIKEKGYEMVNADAVIVAEEPKLSSYIPEMKGKMAAVLEIEEDDMGIKATTNEKLGALGEKKGIAAHSVVLLRKIK